MCVSVCVVLWQPQLCLPQSLWQFPLLDASSLHVAVITISFDERRVGEQRRSKRKIEREGRICEQGMEGGGGVGCGVTGAVGGVASVSGTTLIEIFLSTNKARQTLCNFKYFLTLSPGQMWCL